VNRAARRAKPPAAPAKKTAPKRETSQSKRIAQLEADLKLVAWEHEKLAYTLRMLIAQSMLANPQVQQRMASELAQKMAGKL